MKDRNRFGAITSGILIGLMLVGCSTTELEERSFPMLVAIEEHRGQLRYTEAFPKEDSTGALGAKEKDYSHLKVLVFEEEILEENGYYEKALEEIAKEEKFPRNAYVCVVEDAEELFAMEKLISQDLGTYLEEYLKNHEKNKSKLLTLGDLLDEQANQTMIFYLPYLEVEGNKLYWKGYMNNYGKIWQES